MTQDESRLEPHETDVVAFDFDGTLTVRDSFTAFLKWRAGPRRYAAGVIRLTPALFRYVFNRDRGKLKAAAVREFLKGMPRADLEAAANAFARENSRLLLRPDAVATWKRWREQRVRVAIVTASPDIIVAPFARGLGADVLLGTQLSFDDAGRVRAAFATPNCRGAEKVIRLRAHFGDEMVLRAAYGDTSGDREMLAAAEIKGYRAFSAKP